MDQLGSRTGHLAAGVRLAALAAMMALVAVALPFAIFGLDASLG